ncbi:hypothetical protein HMPREF0569_0108 [Micrococcus luteus SK58]|nr:hypothetical protein HMPREF0569_0108 [Micrococcus luteus SK58]VWX50724.1 conserved hypothetical protein [Micrococcus luteus]
MKAGNGFSERGEFGDVPVQVRQVLGKLITHVAARRRASIPDLEDVEDFGQSEAGNLAAPDEFKPDDRVLWIVAVAVGGSVGLRQEPSLLVKPQGLGRHAGGRRYFTDTHASPRSRKTP